MSSIAKAFSDPEPDAAEDIFVGRQPILDRRLDVFAYELLFRSSDRNRADHVCDEDATNQVLSNTFFEIGFTEMVGDALAFINCPRSVLMDESYLPSDRVVLEVLEHLTVDQALVDGCRARKEQGFRLALDDFIYSPQWRPLMDIADFVKLDVRESPPDEVERLARDFRERGVRLLAEKVETRQEYEWLRGLGFELFQGYFFSRPEVISTRKIPTGSLAALRMIAEFQKPGASAKKLTEIVSHDVSLSYKILRFVNSAALGLPRKIDSVQQAIVLIGLNPLRQWATLIMMNANEPPPAEVTRNALVRAKFCELIAVETGHDGSAAFFMVGLLSCLEQCLRVPLADALGELSLNDECTAALLSFEGRIGRALRCAVAYETCDWEQIAFEPLPANTLTRLYTEASSWSLQTCRGLAAL